MRQRSMIFVHRYFVKKLKNVPRQSWVEQSEDASIPFQNRDLSHLNIKNYRDVKKEMGKGNSEQQLQPMSPKMGPIRVTDLEFFDRKYHWCACGQSLRQPFCDGSHEGTAFSPYTFTIEQRVNQLNLCGCKLTTNKPFCDSQSCKSGSGNRSQSNLHNEQNEPNL